MKRKFNKKGFTLVEMIVVIAIISALAAILIPTLLGYVTRSHVADINSTAGKMRDNVSYFMTQAGSDGYGMFRSHDAICDVEMVIVDKVWTVTTSTQDVFLSQYATKWTRTGSADMDTVEDITNAEQRMACYFARTFRDVVNGYCKFRLIGGVCHALYFTDEQTSEVTEMPPFDNAVGWDISSFKWGEEGQGITTSGIFVGTSPVIKE